MLTGPPPKFNGTRDTVFAMWLKQIYKITYPNTEIYVGLLNQRNVLCLNRNHLFRSIRLCFAHNALPT